MKTIIKIIVVDDDPNDMLQHQEVFHRNGFNEVKCFENTDEMLHFLSESDDWEWPKKKASDIDMQRLSGFELIQSLKRNTFYRGIAILVSSTSALSKYLYLFQKNYLIQGLS